MSENVKLEMLDEATPPSQQVVAKAMASVTVPDANGRSITLRKPGILAQFRQIEMLGDTASNLVYMNLVVPLLYISAINGEDEPAPITKAQLEALISRLGDEGVAAVHEGVQEHFRKTNIEADKAALKN
ncbi:hypothetical protein [Chitinimonas naiadis]